MEPTFPAAPPPPYYPPARVRQNTPFWHCAAGAGIWYLALVVGIGAYKLKRSEPVTEVVIGPLVGFGLVWLLTTTAMWGIFRLANVRLKPWLLIIIAIPITYGMSLVLAFVGLAAFIAIGPR